MCQEVGNLRGPHTQDPHPGPSVAQKPSRTMELLKQQVSSEGKGHTTRTPPQWSAAHKIPETSAGLQGQGRGDLGHGEEGVPVMAQLEFPSNLAGRGQNLCLNNNLM